MATTSQEIRTILDDNGPELLLCISPDVLFVSHLVKHKVVTNAWCKCNLEGKTNAEKVYAILDFVRVGTVKQFDGFVESLKATEQESAVSLLQAKTGGGGDKDLLGDVSSSFASVSITTHPKRLDWHHKISGKLRAFHDNFARHPDRAVNDARRNFEKTMKKIESKLKEKNVCFDFESCAHVNVTIDENDIEFDLMAIMSDGTDLKDESLDSGFYHLKPKDRESEVKYAKVLQSPGVLCPEKVNSFLCGILQKSINDTVDADNVKARKNGPAIQLEVSRDVTSTTKKWFAVNIVPAYLVRFNTRMRYFVAKPYERGISNLCWRMAFPMEEKEILKSLDDKHGCQIMCLRIIKAICKPPQSVKRKPDSSFAYLRSFMVKNALFHECKKGLDWGMTELGPRTIGLISSMAEYIDNGFFPDYFDPCINILAGMDEGPRDNLAKRLQRLVSSEVEFCRVIGAE